MRIRIVDAFTDRPFTGNPAGVLLLDAFPEDSWLQAVAREVNHAETAFAHPLPSGGEADWALRWFTPAAEVDLCGHATLATAHVLRESGQADGEVGGEVRFATRSGVLTARVDPEGGAVTLDFPTSALHPRPVPDGLSEALGGAPVRSAHATSPHVGDLLVELADERSVRVLTPDLALLGPFAPRGVIVTAPAADPAEGQDYVSRCFYPNVGVPEDPVTGSAHTALAPFWSERLGRADLIGLQASPRPGRVRTSWRGARTRLTGHAVTVIDGTLNAGA
ncbi:PhzF family phenazine biosynthesis protein (plasmid) [Streptomyces sp. BI20]|uniref:PhzF family phenazine biosynthesis protein n=1 Tax=Streptomyces sp. BI20 TaxID=3403460 RepID=UPI003C71249C